MREWYAKLAPREQLFVKLGAAAVAVMLLLALIVPLNRNIAQARQRVANKQADLAFIQQAIPQLAAAGSAVAPASPETLVVLVDSSAREGGLGKSLSSSQPTGTGSLRIRLDRTVTRSDGHRIASRFRLRLAAVQLRHIQYQGRCRLHGRYFANGG